MTENELLVIVLMVKNEAVSIEATLNGFFAGGLRHFFILDTGSNDETVLIIHSFFQQHPVIGHIKQEPFIDFASSRNRTLTLAEQHFPHATFFLMPDAEWYLQHPEQLLSFCNQQKTANTPIYLIKIHLNATEFMTARLFRAASQIRFAGVVHEAPTTPAIVQVPHTIYFEVKATPHGSEKTKRRWQQDLLLLSQAFHENKTNPRTSFYLAQTYECLGLLENAYQLYQHRATLAGWDEENFITYYRLGYIASELMKINPAIRWDTAMNYYLQAHALRPRRIEPLVKIAEYYWPNNIPTCYLFIKHTYDIPYPEHDILFIEKHMYIYDRYEIMSRCAWYAEEYVLGEQATLLALKVYPEMEHLLHNLTLYQGKVRC